MALRYVSLPEHPTIIQIDIALAVLRQRRACTQFAQVRAWVDAEIDTALDMRNTAELETRALA